MLLVGSGGKLGAGSNGPLRRAGVAIRTAATAAEALALHRTANADLIVTDLDLPDLTAEQLCRQIREAETFRRVALVVLCGADEGERRRAAECRANVQLIRPEDAEAFAAQLARLLATPLRARYRVLARVTVEDGDEPRSFFCTSENVSATGILLETEEELQLGQTLDCTFYLPGRLRVATQGKVVREAPAASERQFGVQFVDLSGEAQIALEHFVAGWKNLR